MLSIIGFKRFYSLRDFHDMRCKYDRQQMNREPEDGDVFIVMSKDHRLIRLFSYDKRFYSLYKNVLFPVINL